MNDSEIEVCCPNCGAHMNVWVDEVEDGTSVTSVLAEDEPGQTRDAPSVQSFHPVSLPGVRGGSSGGGGYGAPPIKTLAQTPSNEGGFDW